MKATSPEQPPKGTQNFPNVSPTSVPDAESHFKPHRMNGRATYRCPLGGQPKTKRSDSVWLASSRPKRITIRAGRARYLSGRKSRAKGGQKVAAAWSARQRTHQRTNGRRNERSSKSARPSRLMNLGETEKSRVSTVRYAAATGTEARAANERETGTVASVNDTLVVPRSKLFPPFRIPAGEAVEKAFESRTPDG